MALKFVDGFDHYAIPNVGANLSTPLPGWDAASSNTQGLVFGTNSSFARFTIPAPPAGGQVRGLNFQPGGLGAAAYFQKNIPIATEYFMGVAINIVTIVGNHQRIFGFGDGSVYQASVAVNSNGTLSVMGGSNNATVLGTSTAQLPFTDYHYLELHVVSNSSTGTVDLHLDGTSILSLTGQNTAGGSSTNQISSLLLGTLSNVWSDGLFDCYYDDLYCLDTTGANAWSKTFLGDTRIRTMMPNANGTVNQWTANGAASQYQCVDEVTATGGDGDTTYVANSTVGNIQYFTFSNIPTGNNTVYGVAVIMELRKDDAGSRTVRGQCQSPSGTGTSADTGVDGTVPGSYGYIEQFFETDPNTAAQWTAANVNAAEFGLKETA